MHFLDSAFGMNVVLNVSCCFYLAVVFTLRSCRVGDGNQGVVYANHPLEPQGAPTLHYFLTRLREMNVTSMHKASMPLACFRQQSPSSQSSSPSSGASETVHSLISAFSLAGDYSSRPLFRMQCKGIRLIHRVSKLVLLWLLAWMVR